MGGVTKAIGKGLGAVATGGLSVAMPHSLFGKAGNIVGQGLTLGTSKLGGGGSPAVASAFTATPMQVMMETGGAPLLAAIAMGADPNQSLMSFFGASGDYNKWLATLDPESQNAVKGLSTQLNSIQQNTQLKTQAVNKLVNDFPDFMASAIPKYKGIADESTMAAAQQALNQTAAKYAAGGGLSSGAMAAAMARTGAQTAEQNLQFGTQLAGQDWMNQFNQANALLNFQQKMLGQGAQAGQSAIGQLLGAQNQAGLQSAAFQNQQNIANQQSQNAMFGALGSLGGTVLGGTLFGPVGAMAGGQAGGTLASGLSGGMSPRLNVPGYSAGANPYGGGM